MYTLTKEKCIFFLRKKIQPTDTTNLNYFLDLDLQKHLTLFEVVNEAATKEFSLEKALKSMTEAWAPVSWLYTPPPPPVMLIWAPLGDYDVCTRPVNSLLPFFLVIIFVHSQYVDYVYCC